MFQLNLLKDRAIFLTGGGSGLGRSMAIHFAKLGARLFVVGRREEPLKATCDEVHRNGGAAAFATCDVRDYSTVEAAFAAAELQFGEIDTLVNNAAGNFMARTEKLTPNGFNAVVGIVLNGTFHCTQAFAKRRIEKKLGGNVLNITTTYAAANCGSGYVMPSACAKAGVLAMTTSLAVEWARQGVCVNAIAPGVFRTDLNAGLLDGTERGKELLMRTPMHRFGRAEELVSTALYLASGATSFTTGQIIAVDGGFLASGVNQ